MPVWKWLCGCFNDIEDSSILYKGVIFVPQSKITSTQPLPLGPKSSDTLTPYVHKPLLPPPPVNLNVPPPYVPNSRPYGPSSQRLPPLIIKSILQPAPLNLGDPPTQKFKIQPGTETDFRITVRQQPKHAKLWVPSDEERRPVDPPPIIELTQLKTPLIPLLQLRVQCTIWSECGEKLPVQEKYAGVLIGKRLVGPYEFQDDRESRIFFIYPDLCIGVAGQYRLKFDLLHVSPQSGITPNQVIAECISHTLVVYAKHFPGMMHSTKLTKAIAAQGFKIDVRGSVSPNKTSEDNDDTGTDNDSTASQMRSDDRCPVPVSGEVAL
jgi:Velvet factor